MTVLAQSRGVLSRAAALLRAERARFVLAVLICTALAAWLVYPVTQPGIIVNQDAPRHLLRTQLMAEQFLPSGHVDGWSPYWYLGAQLFLFQSYGYFFVIGLAAWLLQSVFALESVFKLFYALPILALPAATAYLARRLGVSRSGAVVAALISITLGTLLGYGMRGLFHTGLLIQAAGVVLFAVAWPSVLDALDGRRGALGKASLLLGATLVVHFISGAYALAASGLLAVAISVHRRSLPVLLRYTALAVLVLLLAGHSLFPALELRDYGGAAVGWGEDGTRLDLFLRGALFGPAPIVLVCYAAAVWAILYERGRLAVTAVILFATGVVALGGAWAWEPRPVTLVLDTLIRPRAVPYACLFTAVFAGVAFDRAMVVLHALGRRTRPALAAVVAAALLVVVGTSVVRELVLVRGRVHTESSFRGERRREFMKMTAWLRSNVPAHSILAVDRRSFDWARLGVRSVISMLNLHTGLFTLGGDQAELTWAASRGPQGTLDSQPDVAKLAQRLRGYGVSYVLLSSKEARERFSASPDFDEAYGDKHVAIYRLRGGGLWLHGPEVNTLRFRYAPEHLQWSLHSKSGGTAILAVSPHPNWQARIDGEPALLSTAKDYLLRVDVPAGRHELVLDYVRRPTERLYNWLSLATLVAILGSCSRSYVRSRRRYEYEWAAAAETLPPP